MTRIFPLCCLLFAIGICSKSGAQNVGIGNANPTSRLDVIGNNSSDTLFHVKSANQSSRLVVLDNGKVGIGTTQPRAMLSLRGDTPHILFSNLNGGAPSWRIGQQTSSNGGDLILRTA